MGCLHLHSTQYFLERLFCMDKELSLCVVDADYLKYLHKVDYRVSVKYNNRPYVGIIVMIGGSEYVVPLTSQTTAEREKEGKRKRASVITTFIRDTAGNEIADLLHNNMIPVKTGVYSCLVIDATTDTYEANEIRFIRKHKEQIIHKAQKVHDDRILKYNPFLYKVCCDFIKLEEACNEYQKS